MRPSPPLAVSLAVLAVFLASGCAQEDCNDNNPCTVDTRTDGTCQYAPAPAGTECRGAAGGCDIAETCDGTATECPGDTVVAAATECRAVAGECDVAESCDGTNAACPSDAFVAGGTVCRAGASFCDPAETCSGSAGACPADVIKTATLYGAQGGNSSTSNLYSLNPADAASTSIGALGEALTGMSQHPLTGVVYGVTSQNSPHPRSLVSIDLATGAATFVVALMQDASSATVAELEFAANGTLYCWTESSDDLCTIDIATGDVTVPGDSGVSSYGDAMAFTKAGTLYVLPRGSSGDIYTANLATGEVTSVGTVNGLPDTTQCGDSASLGAGTVEPSNGTFFATRIDNCGGGQPYASSLVTVDLTSGAGTSVGALPAQTDALAFVCQP